MIEFITFEIDFCATECFREAAGKMQGARPTDVVLSVVIKLFSKFSRLTRGSVSRFEFQDQWHQRLSNETSPKNPKVASLVGPASI